MLAAAGGSDRRIFELAAGMENSSVFDLTFTVDDKGATTPLTLADRSGRHRRLDRPRSGGARQAHRRTRSDRHRAAGDDADLLPLLGAAASPPTDRIEVCGGNSSGEVEFVLIGWQGRIFVGCGSDHTDRKVEAYSVTVSKQMCDKPMASVLWELEDVIGHWDQMILRSWAVIDGTRVLYQEGTLDAMLPVKDLIDARLRRQGTARRLRHVRRHLCRQGRHPPGEPLRVRAGRSRAEAQDQPWL